MGVRGWKPGALGAEWALAQVTQTRRVIRWMLRGAEPRAERRAQALAEQDSCRCKPRCAPERHALGAALHYLEVV